MRGLSGSPKKILKEKNWFSYMSENLITCKGANRFSLSELVSELGQEPGEHSRTTQHCFGLLSSSSPISSSLLVSFERLKTGWVPQLGLYNTSLYSSGKDAKPSKS
jgi:hypothetical protein